MKRVLVLHGHTENAYVFGRKFNDIRDALKGDVEFVFVDAPHLLTPVDPPGLPIFSTAEEFAKFENMDPKCPTKHTPRAWYYYLRDVHDVWALSQSLIYIRDLLERDGPFHGIMGYSQGGAMAALITGLLEYPDHVPHFKGIKHPPMEFCVTFSAFLIPKNAFEVPKNVRTPSLFVIGENDSLVPAEWTHLLSKQFCNARLEIHNGGHFVPRKPEWRAFLIGFFKTFAGSSDDSKGSRFGSPLFEQSLRGAVGSYVPSAGIPFPLLTTTGAERAKLKARETLAKGRRKSWTEVVPKTIWEGGFEGDNLDEIDEEVERVAMEPVSFDEGYNVSRPAVTTRSVTTKRGGLGVGVHFFDDVPRAPVNPRLEKLSSELPPVSIDAPTPQSSFSDDDSPGPGTPELCPSSILLKSSNCAVRSRKLGDASAFGRRPSFQVVSTNERAADPLAKLLRVQTIGGREIVVQSAYDGDEAPFDFEIDLERGHVDIHGDAVDGSF